MYWLVDDGTRTTSAESDADRAFLGSALEMQFAETGNASPDKVWPMGHTILFATVSSAFLWAIIVGAVWLM